jgi:hypothetical protein
MLSRPSGLTRSAWDAGPRKHGTRRASKTEDDDMEEEKDWRLTGQERYLMGRILVRKTYISPRADWDHDHCAFCWAKFMRNGEAGTCQEGYVTEDNQCWICLRCFADFKNKFQWTVTEN